MFKCPVPRKLLNILSDKAFNPLNQLTLTVYSIYFIINSSLLSKFKCQDKF